MAMQVATEAQGPERGSPRAGAGDPPDSTLAAAALVAALEGALLAARHLLQALDMAPEYTPTASGPIAPVRPDTAYPGGLTTREAEVLRLIAAGMSNREMAEALCRSERTVERHIENIYRKIGAHSKADATAYAFRHGLA